ncbi:MAG: hypothetical protein WBP41_20020 [Saprospiraceae bacterium]
MESIIKKMTTEELSSLQNIRFAHQNFLTEIKVRLSEIYEQNSEVFRRPPDIRIKKIKSIVGKIEDDPQINNGVIYCVNKLTDIAGARMTITTKDEIELATKLLISGLKDFGDLDTISRATENGILNDKTGYSAYHYYLKPRETEKYGINSSIVCEIQVRTLAQDLWAVFSHPESYKPKINISPSTIDAEMKNYAKLMDVADDFAQLIKKRKKIEADEYHKNQAKESGRIFRGKTLITVDVLNEILLDRLNRDISNKIEKVFKLSIFELCKIVKNLHTYGVFNKEELEEILNDIIFENLIRQVMKDCNVNDIEIVDSIHYFCICHKMFILAKLTLYSSMLTPLSTITS